MRWKMSTHTRAVSPPRLTDTLGTPMNLVFHEPGNYSAKLSSVSPRYAAAKVAKTTA